MASKANGLTPTNTGHFLENSMSNFGHPTNENDATHELYEHKANKW